MWGNEKAYKVLVLKLKVRDHLECLAVDSGNIKMDLEDVDWEGMQWIDLGSRRVASFFEHGNEPSAYIKRGISCLPEELSALQE